MGHEVVWDASAASSGAVDGECWSQDALKKKKKKEVVWVSVV
jgi:hypothetical protein